jgi:hypothetical protein
VSEWRQVEASRESGGEGEYGECGNDMIVVVVDERSKIGYGEQYSEVVLKRKRDERIRRIARFMSDSYQIHSKTQIRLITRLEFRLISDSYHSCPTLPDCDIRTTRLPLPACDSASRHSARRTEPSSSPTRQGCCPVHEAQGTHRSDTCSSAVCVCVCMCVCVCVCVCVC